MASKSKPLIIIVFLATLIECPSMATSQSSDPFLNMPPPASVANFPPPPPAGSGTGSGSGSFNPYAPPVEIYPPPLGTLPNNPPIPYVYYPAPPPPDPILPYFPWYYRHSPPKPNISSANLNDAALMMMILHSILLGLALQ